MSAEQQSPGFFQKRKMLESSDPPVAELARRGGQLAEEGLFDEAVAFLARAGDDEGLESLLARCREAGDAFSFDAALRALGRSAGREEWEGVGRRALEKGQLWFAYRAFEKADFQEGLERVRRAMAEEGIDPPA